MCINTGSWSVICLLVAALEEVDLGLGSGSVFTEFNPRDPLGEGENGLLKVVFKSPHEH